MDNSGIVRKELKKTHEWFLELASLSPEMREQLRHDILAVKHEIQVWQFPQYFCLQYCLIHHVH
jgi:hypothetical protein